LFAKLVEARTFAERMFRVVFLDRLNEKDSRDAILKPIQACPRYAKLLSVLANQIIKDSGGYPYFIQFIAREMVDVLLQADETGEKTVKIPITGILRKLDNDFFAGRWARATDRQRDLLGVIARLEGCENEFSVQQIVEHSGRLATKPFRASRVSQMLGILCNAGLVYKNRHGRYSFAVPLLGRFIMRQQKRALLEAQRAESDRNGL
jgi:hypothetical protein